jgi:hypothetical protein
VTSGRSDEAIRRVTAIVTVADDIFVGRDITVGLIAALEAIAKHVAIFRLDITDSQIASTVAVAVNVLLRHNLGGNVTGPVSGAINVVVSGSKVRVGTRVEAIAQNAAHLNHARLLTFSLAFTCHRRLDDCR